MPRYDEKIATRQGSDFLLRRNGLRLPLTREVDFRLRRKDGGSFERTHLFDTS